MDTMAVIELEPFTKTKDKYGSAKPYCIAFVYSKHSEIPFMVKGMSPTIREYVKNTFSFAIINITLFGPKRSKGNSNYWIINGVKAYMNSKNVHGKRRWVLTYFVNGSVHRKVFRRVPHRWLSEYNEADRILRQPAQQIH